jgi:putative zinc- or iron-chelating protein
MSVDIKYQASARRCGDCQLCCKLLPVKEGAKIQHFDLFEEMVKVGIARPGDFTMMVDDFDKPAGQRCPHQRHGKGCMIYSRRPFGCRFWNCRWLLDEPGTESLSRPDRAHYVLDVAPDYVTTDGGEKIEVVQIWLDPDYPEAHRDPALRKYLLQRGEEKVAALVRLNAREAFLLVPPQMSADGQFFERRTEAHNEPQHSGAQIAEALGGVREIRLRIS